ncbi:protein of unknown function [Candidatus Methylacidiphilum fumarolicum]|uniref:Uncharacterized protein n=1 Tax=Candidatus Methylacidiphilum fumarolicum TaxID=591154 RepID=A0ABN8XG94_9BACT|nr:protein of unknown function [Candidatus Methylacidiphilum fumarolicum]
MPVGRVELRPVAKTRFLVYAIQERHVLYNPHTTQISLRGDAARIHQALV